MPFLLPWEKTTCPFCFREFHLSEAPTRPFSYSGEWVPDPQMGEFLNQFPPPQQPPLTPPPTGIFSRWRRRFYVRVCRDEGPESGHRICPYCHMFLPQALGNWNRKSDIIAIVGSRSSGKSNYFGVLLKLLEQRYTAQLGFGMRPLPTFDVRSMRRVNSRELYEQRYGKRLFRDGQIIQQTERSAVDADIKIPLIYQLSQTQYHRGKERHSSIDLVIFDAAGEDLNTMTNFEIFGRYAVKASGIIVMIDPFRYESIYRLLTPEVQAQIPNPTAMEGTPDDIIDYLLNAKINERGTRPGQKIQVPTAIAMTKIDLLRGLLPKNSTLLRETKHDGTFNAPQCQRKSGEMIDFLRNHGAGELEANVRSQFGNYAFFGVSALGHLPQGEHLSQNLRPVNVADPLLWILRQLQR